MKKLILFSFSVLMCIASFAQPFKSILSKSDTVYVDMSKTKVIVLVNDSSRVPMKIISVDVLGNSDAVYATKQYWYDLLRWMKFAKNGDFSQIETERLQSLFFQYASDWERMIKQSQSKQ